MKETEKENRPTILVVEDDQNQLRATCQLIEKLDVDVHQAESGQKALSLMLREHFKLVILDINMPEIDGIETAKLMRKNKYTENTPIIFMTAYDQDEKRVQQGYKLGALDYVFKPLHEEILISKIKMFLRISEIEELQKKKEKKNKEREYAEKYISELKNKNDELRQSQIAALNIMEDANNAKNELSLKAEELERANKELNQFAYIASHDLQEPLRTVMNYIQVIREDYFEDLNDRTQEYIERISNASKRMKSLISAMLDFSRLGRGKIPKIVKINRLLEQVKEDISDLITKSDIELIFNDLPELYVYEDELRMVFQNLISNSIKFSKPDKKPRVNIQCKEVKKYWQFSVSDNGIGIKKKNLDIIFQIFQRLHLKNEYEGDGIGLASCKKIVELHKGEIWAESDIDRGTTIHFTISNLTPNEKE